MVAYVSIPLGMALGMNEKNVFLALALLFAAFYINSAAWMMLAANLEKRGQGATTKKELTTVTMPRAIIEGGETILFYSLFILFPELLTILFGLLAVLVLASATLQVSWAHRNIREKIG